MSEERDLLREIIKSSYFIGYRLLGKVEKLLAETEQEPKKELMTDRDISRVYPDHYCAMEKEAFKIGIKWYEKYVARIGVYSNE